MTEGGEVRGDDIMRGDGAYLDLTEFGKLNTDLEFAAIGSDAERPESTTGGGWGIAAVGTCVCERVEAGAGLGDGWAKAAAWAAEDWAAACAPEYDVWGDGGCHPGGLPGSGLESSGMRADGRYGAEAGVAIAGCGDAVALRLRRAYPMDSRVASGGRCGRSVAFG